MHFAANGVLKFFVSSDLFSTIDFTPLILSSNGETLNMLSLMF